MGRFSLVALLSALLLFFASPAAGVGQRSYHDALGDVYCCTRDLTDVVVRNDDAGTITFNIQYDATYEGDDDDDLYVLLDTDRNPATGERNPGLGADFMIGAHVGARGADAVTLFAWRKGRMHEYPTKLIRVTVTGKLIRVSLDRHLIGDTDGFDFNVQVWEVAQGNAYVDGAPDRGSWSFPVVIPLRALRPSLTTSRHARPDHRFVARLALRVANTGRLLGSGRLDCRASIRGQRLRPVYSAFAARRATCAWIVPPGSRGRTLRGFIAVDVSAHARVTRRFARVIR